MSLPIGGLWPILSTVWFPKITESGFSSLRLGRSGTGVRFRDCSGLNSDTDSKCESQYSAESLATRMRDET